MKDDWKAILLCPALAVFLVGAWFAGSWSSLRGADLWVLRGGLAAFGISAAGLYWWRRSRQNAAPPSEGPTARTHAASDAGLVEAESVLREAAARLRSSAVGRPLRPHSVPVLFFLGESGSGKTSAIVLSGLEQELLAGQVYQDSSILPTRAANLWFSQGTVLAEVGGRALGSSELLLRAVTMLTRRGWRARLREGTPPPRTAVVCVDLVEFLNPDADRLAAQARNLRERLGQMAQALRINLPVYVLFTKLDRIASFADFVNGWTREEAAQVVGATFPLEAELPGGAWAEQQAARVSDAFDRLYLWFCDQRALLLHRECDREKFPGVYEFPRDLRKLRSSLAQFLVDLTRPFQVRCAPFLRGFYFCGVREVTAAASAVTAAAGSGPAVTAAPPSATSIFRSDQAPSPAAPMRAAPALDATAVFTGEPMPAGGRDLSATPVFVPPKAVPKIRQGVFIGDLFNHVLLRNPAAGWASGSIVKVSFARRVLLAAGVALAALGLAFLVLSFLGNRALQRRVIDGARELAAVPGGAQTPSQEALLRLDGLRQVLAELSAYRNSGVPWMLDWGLYIGEQVHGHARQIYAERFRQVLLVPAQLALVEGLRSLPAHPGRQDDHRAAYERLKAYLITTSYPEKGGRHFLAPLLLQHWERGRGLSEKQKELALRQFEFYAEQQGTHPLCRLQADAALVQQARSYLQQFDAVEMGYQRLLNQASAANRPVSLVPNPVVTSPRTIPGCFTRDGWMWLQTAFRNPDRVAAGEDWVVETPRAQPGELEQALVARYRKDFLAQWRGFLKSAAVVRFVGARDAANKLRTLTEPTSPLLALFCLASENTAVGEPVSEAFEAVQSVAPPGCQSRPVSPANNGYMAALMDLRVAVEQVAKNPDKNNRQQAAARAAGASATVSRLASNFNRDSEARLDEVVRRLMLEPVQWAESSIKPAVPDGRPLCAEFRKLAAKFPFTASPNAPPAHLEEIKAFFQPGEGLLSRFADQRLAGLVVRQGSRYIPDPQTAAQVNPEFLEFLNRGAEIGRALCQGASPSFQYTLRAYPNPVIASFRLAIDGRVLTVPGNEGPLQFVWPGAQQQEGLLTTSGFEVAGQRGLWGVFHLFYEATRVEVSGPVTRFEWNLRRADGGEMKRPDGTPLTIRAEVDAGGGPPVFKRDYLTTLRCVSRIGN